LTQNLLMGGNNGFTDFKTLLGVDLHNSQTQRTLYIITAVTLFVVYIGLRWLTKTKFGLVQRAIRDSETRVLFSGYAAANYKLFVFVLAAMISAIAGALFIPQVGAINPSEMSPVKSLEAVVWCAVGGRGTLVGPIVGAISVNWLKNEATRLCPNYWLIILGSLFILVVLFLPGGIVSIPERIKALLGSKSKAEPEPEAEEEVPAPGTPTDAKA
jgi:urea ABC transporter permease protein UrtC